MKTSKISLVAVLALALTLGLAASSWARPGGGMGGGMGCNMGAMNLTPDQAGKFFDLKEKFRNDTAAARKQMMVKHAELAALWKAEKPDQAAITAKQKEVNALRDQMQEKRTAFQLEARKIAPELAQGFGCGMGRGMGGGGMGHGGCPMVGPGGGMGPGAGPGPAAPAK
jgi:Spy/CpxP family protein refolding chaperone